jgi:hypothetical protein
MDADDIPLNTDMNWLRQANVQIKRTALTMRRLPAPSTGTL